MRLAATPRNRKAELIRPNHPTNQPNGGGGSMRLPPSQAAYPCKLPNESGSGMLSVCNTRILSTANPLDSPKKSALATRFGLIPMGRIRIVSTGGDDGCDVYGVSQPSF